MNKNLLLGLLCLFLGSSSAFATPFDQANGQFKAGDYAGAAAAYEQVLAADGPRAAVFYNLGNSYQQLKQYGPAILAYERARLLTPRDPDLLANLVKVSIPTHYEAGTPANPLSGSADRGVSSSSVSKS